MLILSGSWFGKSGFYEAEIEEIKFYDCLSKVENFQAQSFVVFSFDLSSELLNLTLKKASLPPVIEVKIRNFGEIRRKKAKHSLSFIGSSLKAEEFKERVERIRKYIEEGTIYQVNLTNRFDFEFNGDSESLFFHFYRNQPVPYGFYLKAFNFFIISGSMELFLERKGSTISTKPIKGTSKSLKFLQDSYKDKAENLMITDMMRNDIGRISKIGSVVVPELFKITKYRTLYQMHSTVKGITDSDFKEIIKATFPPASVTGAPKTKAVEIINILEPHARGYYCGCAGLIRNETDFTFSVLIRTAVGLDKELSYYAGCGIVWDSHPEKELDELYLKIKAFYRKNF